MPLLILINNLLQILMNKLLLILMNKLLQILANKGKGKATCAEKTTTSVEQAHPTPAVQLNIQKEKGKATTNVPKKGKAQPAAPKKGKAPGAPSTAQHKSTTSKATTSKGKYVQATSQGVEIQSSQTTMQAILEDEIHHSQASTITISPQEALGQLINAHKTTSYILEDANIPHSPANKKGKLLLELGRQFIGGERINWSSFASNYGLLDSGAVDDYASILRGLVTPPK
ncbi:putative chloroplast RF1 [Sesbania bispinosa]|nr:putative chloroplast RF1 [Sesbania bispinosa]